eukprot:scaffold6018_cov97-Skeletonema_menzelii.AAC.1
MICVRNRPYLNSSERRNRYSRAELASMSAPSARLNFRHSPRSPRTVLATGEKVSDKYTRPTCAS